MMHSTPLCLDQLQSEPKQHSPEKVFLASPKIEREGRNGHFEHDSFPAYLLLVLTYISYVKNVPFSPARVLPTFMPGIA